MSISLIWILMGCPGGSPKKPLDTDTPLRDTGPECEDQESIHGTSISPQISGILVSDCNSYERGIVSSEENLVAISSEYCPDTQDAEGNLSVYSFPELELKFEIQGSYPYEFLGGISVDITEIEGVGTGPLVSFNWIEENSYPVTLYGGADIYDINTGMRLTQIHSMRNRPGAYITFLDDFWVLGTPDTEQTRGQIHLYNLRDIQSETNPSDAIAAHYEGKNMSFGDIQTIGDSDGDGLNDLLVAEAADYWFLSQEDAIYDDGFLNAISLPVRNTDDVAFPTSAPDWDGDGLEDIAVMDMSQSSGDVRIVSPIFQWPIATYVTSDPEALGHHLERVNGFSGEGEEGILADKIQEYVGPTSYYLLHPGGCGTIEIEDVGDILIQDELPIGYTSIWGQGQLLMFIPEHESDETSDTENSIYLLTPEE